MIKKNKYRFTRFFVKRVFKLWLKLRVHWNFVSSEVILKSIKAKGEDCRIKGDVIIAYPEKLALGDYIRIGSKCFLFCKGGLEIGDNTQISRFVTIYTSNHNIDSGAIPYDDTYVHKKVIIGKSVWIGMHVCITPGVTIGDGAVIGMGTVISKDIPPGAVVVGASQRIIKFRDMAKFAEFDSKRQYFGKLWPDA